MDDPNDNRIHGISAFGYIIFSSTNMPWWSNPLSNERLLLDSFFLQLLFEPTVKIWLPSCCVLYFIRFFWESRVVILEEEPKQQQVDLLLRLTVVHPISVSKFSFSPAGIWFPRNEGFAVNS